jgi:hypothetical protein
LVALKACVDARSATVVESGAKVGSGFLVEDLLYFGRFNGLMKIQGADGQQEGKCAD